MAYTVIQGCSQGLGQSFARLLLARTDNPVIALTHSSLDQVKHALLLRQEGAESKLTVLEADITKEVELKRAAEWVKERYGRKMGMLCNFAGVLYPEKNIASMELDKLQRTYEINTFGHALMFKHFLPLVPRASRQEREEAEGPGEQGRSVLVSLSAKVGSIEDNRTGGWYSYRSSKAATNQLVRTVAREVEMRNVWATVIAYHPGTVRTGLAAEFVQGKSGKGIHDAEKAAELMYKVVTEVKAVCFSTGNTFSCLGEAVCQHSRSLHVIRHTDDGREETGQWLLQVR